MSPQTKGISLKFAKTSQFGNFPLVLFVERRKNIEQHYVICRNNEISGTSKGVSKINNVTMDFLTVIRVFWRQKGNTE